MDPLELVVGVALGAAVLFMLVGSYRRLGQIRDATEHTEQLVEWWMEKQKEGKK